MPQTIYRCWNDSSHLVAIKYFKKSYEKEENFLKSYDSEFVVNHGKSHCKRGTTIKNDDEDILYKAYLESLNYKKHDRYEIMKEYLIKNNYPYDEDKIKIYLRKKEKSLISRIDRFRKKALNNEWNYFVTITYDNKKHDENTFKTKLKKCLANLHTRYGYKYMGVFERSKVGRLHFHALMFIPKGEMRGEIKIIKDYSTEDKKMRVAHINTFFEKQFGRNDFIQINSKRLMKDNTINYLLKYISKSEEPIFYSRAIATYHYLDLTEEDVVCIFGDFVKKYVLFDDVIEDKSKIVEMRC